MPTTPVYAFRYPAAADPADVPTDMNELALDVEGVFKEIAYAEKTTNTNAPVGAAAAGTEVVSAGAITYAAVPIIIEFYCEVLFTGTTSGSATALQLFDASTHVGEIATVQGSGIASLGVPCLVRKRLTPTAGSHTYRILANAAGSAGTVTAGAGGPGQNAAAFIRITRA